MTEPESYDLAEPDWEACMTLLDSLPGLPIAERVSAIERLVRNASPGIRQRAVRMGAALLPEERLVGFLREEGDDILRNAGLEIMKAKGVAALPIAVALLKDADSDVVLQAILIVDHVRDPRGLEPMRPLLHHPDMNVIQAAIMAIGHLGDSRSVPDLLPFLAGDPWLQAAAIQALGDLRCRTAVRPLRDLLPDLLLGPFAAEALARIGGAEVYQTLCHHWDAYRETLDAESTLGLLAYVAQGLSRVPVPEPRFVDSIAPILSEDSPGIRAAAARYLLTAGPSPQDPTALRILAETEAPGEDLPAPLARRRDLCAPLLAMGSPYREWGLLLLARWPSGAAASDLAHAMAGYAPPRGIVALVNAVRRQVHPEVTAALLELYLRSPQEFRASLAPALRAHRVGLRPLLSSQPRLQDEDRLLLEIHLGLPAPQIVRAILSLPPERRLAVLPQASLNRAVVRRLPWRKWIQESPERYVPFYAELAGPLKLFEALPMLRPFLSTLPSPKLVQAVGALGDRESVAALVDLAGHSDPLLRAHALDSLGSIGGPAAREALAASARTRQGREVRLAYHALSRCAAEEDLPLFREGAAHADWMVRMASADVLRRFPTGENLGVLAALAADPVAAVSQKAQAFLET